MKLAEATWPQVAGLGRDAVVLIPTGATEQHGPHLPLATDALLAAAVAEGAEAELGEATLLVPTVWLGASELHAGFPGTLAASFEAYEAGLVDVVSSLARHGFRRFVLLNGHGGNAPLNALALRRLRAADPSLELAGFDYWSGLESVLRATLKGRSKELRHGCEAETSLMLAVRPDLVRMDLARADGLEPAGAASGRLYAFDELSEHGALGDPHLAEAETGRRLLAAAVAGAIARIRALASAELLLGPSSGEQ